MSDLHSSATAPARSALLRHARRRQWARLLLYLMIFLSGIAVGGGGTLILVRNSVLHAVHHPENMPKMIAHRMRRTLDLSNDQVQQVETILRERQVALQEIRCRYQPQVEAELDRIEAQISEILSADQQAKWRKRFEDLRRTWTPAPTVEREDVNK